MTDTSNANVAEPFRSTLNGFEDVMVRAAAVASEEESGTTASGGSGAAGIGDRLAEIGEALQWLHNHANSNLSGRELASADCILLVVPKLLAALGQAIGTIAYVAHHDSNTTNRANAKILLAEIHSAIARATGSAS